MTDQKTVRPSCMARGLRLTSWEMDMNVPQSDTRPHKYTSTERIACRTTSDHSANHSKWLTALSRRQQSVCGFEENARCFAATGELRACSRFCVGFLERWTSSPQAAALSGMRKLVNPWKQKTESTHRSSEAGWNFPFLHSPVLNQVRRAKWLAILSTSALPGCKAKNAESLHFVS